MDVQERDIPWNQDRPKFFDLSFTKLHLETAVLESVWPPHEFDVTIPTFIISFTTLSFRFSYPNLLNLWKLEYTICRFQLTKLRLETRDPRHTLNDIKTADFYIRTLL